MTQEKTIVLDADQQAVVLRHITEVQQALGTLGSIVKANQSLNRELAFNVLKVSEYGLVDLGAALGVETEGAQQVLERNQRLREANGRIRELERQLGDVQAPELTQLNLRKLAERLDAWWDLEGFAHITEMNFAKYCAIVKFSCHLFGDFRLTSSKTPVSDKSRKEAWHDSLRERGFVLVDDDGEVALADCDANRQALVDLFAERLPSAQVSSFDNIHRRKNGFVLRDVKVYIHKIDEILTLPIEADAQA